MNKLLLLPMLAGVMLFAGCEATVVERGPGYHYGYVERDSYYRGYHSPYHRSRHDQYYVTPGYYSTGTAYHAQARAPYRGIAGYQYNRNVNRTEIVATHTTVNRPVAQQTTVVKKKAHKKKDDRDHH